MLWLRSSGLIDLSVRSAEHMRVFRKSHNRVISYLLAALMILGIEALPNAVI